MDNVPMQAYEYTMARFERIIKRLVIALIVAVTLIFATNLAWLYVWNQYDYSDVTVESQDNGLTAYMGNNSNGDINNGTSNSQGENAQESE